MDHGVGHTDKDVTRQSEKGKGNEKVLLWRVIMRRIIKLTEDGKNRSLCKKARGQNINLRIEYQVRKVGTLL